MSLSNLSSIVLPAMICGIILLGLFKHVKVYECFAEGAKDGLESSISIIIPLVGLLMAVTVFRASGALDLIAYLLSPITKALNMPKEVLPLALLKPVSGSGSLAIINDIFSNAGPDSKAGNIASVIMGSTETTFYVLAVYFGSIGIKNYRYTLVSALIADVVGIIASCALVNIFL